MPNHLANETSPYLLQHLDNPVDWYPWGDEALARAKKENKPILLSIGYAACHWCHVMAHESFEDKASAELMNRWFINIKVDREERPDLDSIYMSAVTTMTGHGGWPMTVFLTPDGKPFFSGTYFPPEARHGLPAFRQVLSGVADAWENRTDEVLESADKVSQNLQAGLAVASQLSTLDDALLEQAMNQLSTSFDRDWGGFGSAPKFPQAMVLEFLIRERCRTKDDAALEMLSLTLRRMAEGGIYDQLGGGFARYSTDQRWLVPHFEKMLYDNAQLARVYLRAFQVTGEKFFKTIVEQTLDYVLTEMTHKDGGFYSSQDADSEGVEGKFFVWSKNEIAQVLGEDAELFSQVFDISEGGNWEGKNILQVVKKPEEVAEAMGLNVESVLSSLGESKARLYQHRSKRIWPGLDDKILVSWNGLMLSAFAEAGRVLGREDYVDAAVKNAQFLQRELKQPDGRLLRTWKSGHKAKYNAYLEDYACLAEALLTLYETTFDATWFKWSEELAALMLNHFKNPEEPGFYDTSDDHEQLIHRPRDVQDNAMPSGSAKASMVLFRLGLYQGKTEWLDVAQEALLAVSELLSRYPAGFGEWLNLASFMLGRPRQLALIGPLDQLQALKKVVNSHYQSHLVVAAGDGTNSEIALLVDRNMIDGKPTAYLCENFTCRLPVTKPKELARELYPEKSSDISAD